MFKSRLPVFALILLALPAWGKTPLTMRLIRDTDQRFHVEASARVRAPESIVLATLRDYDHMSDFIPSIIVSHRAMRDGRPVIVQTGMARFLVFRFEAKTVLVEEVDAAAHRLTLKGVDGDFSRFDSFWTFRPMGKDTEFELTSEAALKRWVPQWLARRQMKKSVAESLNALIAEMERRSRAAN